MYQDLCKAHKTFRDRSENVDVSVEVTLQPWHAFKPDGVVLFSDILTPLTGMNIPFDIVAGTGPVIAKPIRTLEDVAAVGTLDAEGETPYVGGALEKVSCLTKHSKMSYVEWSSNSSPMTSLMTSTLLLGLV